MRSVVVALLLLLLAVGMYGNQAGWFNASANRAQNSANATLTNALSGS